MITGYESMAVLALINRDHEAKGNKRVEVCRNCGKAFITDDAREFCSYDCQRKSA